ncbi:regulatory protein RecX [Salinibacterium soli]|uniref:Regulatory protein RecX n=1 Tax=Antiquaquibacter soli TaxID=3064523 RepID=A0ABT9BL17_9MICO|nr:regulatory protein RecX [Protaetiibacter sp. WY-16]MDO7881717.1 regulatory protein RecX [Protaetiibacter sp. WY-16]
MASTDGERLAPVTWLFGAPAPTAQDAPDSVASPSVAPPVASTSAAPRLARSQEEVVRHLAEEADQIVARRSETVEKSRRSEEPGRFQRINNVSMHALGRRGMSTAEMREYLLGREFALDEVEGEIDRLLGVGLLDDFALAETLIRTLRDRKGLGRSALVAELRRRKLDGEAVDAALEDLDDDEFARALSLAEKRAGQLRSLDDETAKRRLGAFLMRKGYSGAVVQAVVARALSRAAAGPVFR